MRKAKLFETARRHGGHFTTGQARDLHVSARTLATMARTGEIARVHRGVYRFVAVPQSPSGRIAAALLAAGAGAVASHWSAAWLLDLGRVGTTRKPHVCVAGSAQPQLEDVTVHRTAALPPCDTTGRPGLPCTTGARTLIDLAAHLDRDARIALTDDAICARLTSRSWLHRRACALRNGRAGVGTLVEVTAPGAAGVFHSWLERRFGSLLSLHGLPQPRWNVRLTLHAGRRATVDAYWDWAPLVVELEGLRFHTSPRQRRHDAARFNLISLTPLPLLRFTWWDVQRDTDRVVAEVRQGLGLST